MYSAGVGGDARYGKRFVVFDSHTTYLVFVVGAQKYAVFVFFRIRISKYVRWLVRTDGQDQAGFGQFLERQYCTQGERTINIMKEWH
jgi:hypothetical protein